MKKDRKRVRLKNFNYSSTGYYFITICSYKRQHVFGKIVEEKISLTDIGVTVEKCWFEIPNHFTDVEIDAFIVMPNHVHGIIFIQDVGCVDVGNAHGRSLPSLSTIVNQFKSSVTRIIRDATNETYPIWQKSFHDNIVRDQQSLQSIRKYIRQNPQKWQDDIFSKPDVQDR